MNHYIKSIAAKNLYLMEVIQPRLASRFEPTSQRFLPAESSLRNSMSMDVEPIYSTDQFAQDHDSSNHYAPDSYAKAAARNIVARSSPALAAGNPDSPGPEALVDTDSTGGARPQSKQYRTISPISELKEPFSSSRQGEGDMQANFETSRQSSLPSEGITSDRSSSRELSYERKSTRRKSEGQRSERIVPLSVLEQNQNLSLKAVDRPASRIMQQEEEIVPMASIEDVEKKKVAVGGVRHETVEPIARIKPLTLPVSPGMVAAQPYVKSYFKQERNKILDRAAKPETSAPVQVTIGRIEIKATPVTAGSQRKRPEPPVMSLQDYLKIKRGSL